MKSMLFNAKYKASAIWAIVVLTLISCETNNKYILDGSFTGDQDEEWIYMVKFLGDYSERDSVRIENGKFRFEGVINTPEVYALHYQMDKITGVASLFIEPGNLSIEIDPQNWDLNSKVTGGKINNEFYGFETKRLEKFIKPISELEKRLAAIASEEKRALTDSLRILKDKNHNYELDYVKGHTNSPLSLFIFHRLSQRLSLDDIGEVLQKFDTTLRSTLIFKTLAIDYQNQLAIKDKTLGIDLRKGFDVTEFNFNDGSLIKALSEINPNKVLYVDFWGTWCGPCRDELPYSQELFNKLDTAKVAMVYLCMNSRREDWLNTIMLERLNGQHFLINQDLINKFNDENQIGMNGVPHYIIIDKEGKLKYKSAPKPSSEQTVKIMMSLI